MKKPYSLLVFLALTVLASGCELVASSRCSYPYTCDGIGGVRGAKDEPPPTGLASADGGVVSGDSRDLIGDQAEIDQAVVIARGRAFAQKNALAEDVGIEIARSFRDWEIIGKSRARTEQDTKEYTRRIFGVEYRDFQAAARRALQGDAEGLENLNRDVAVYWGTTPETTNRILTEWYREKLAR